MLYSIIVEPEALDDLQSIFRYISQKDSQNKAIAFVRELEMSISTLSEMPFRCRKSYYTDDETTRDLIHKGYTIVFQVNATKVHILTIFRQK